MVPIYLAPMSALKAWRDTRNPKVTQAKLAEMLGTKQSHVSDIERDEDRVTLEVALRVFSETGVLIGKLKGSTPQQARAMVKTLSAGAA